MQVRLEVVEQGAARGSLGQQLAEPVRAEEAIHGASRQLELSRYPADRIPGGVHLVNRGVPVLSSRDQAWLLRHRGVARAADRLLGFHARFPKAGVMASDGSFDRLTQVVPQVPAISHLHRVRRTRVGSLGEGAGSIAADDLDAGVLGQPVAKGLGLPIRQEVALWEEKPLPPRVKKSRHRGLNRT